MRRADKTRRARDGRNHTLNILNSFRMLRLLSGAFGVVYFRLDNETGKLRKPNEKMSALYTTIYTALYLVLFLRAWSHKVDNTRAPFLFQWTTEVFLLVLSLSVFVRVGLGLPLRKALTVWINVLSDYDRAFHDIGLTIKYRSIKTTIRKLYILALVACSFKMMAFTLSYKPKWSVVLFTLTLYGTRSVMKYLAICLMVHLRERFESINRMMCCMMADTRSPSSIADKIKRLCQLHFKLAHAAKKLNAIVSTELLISFGFSLVSLFFFGYYFYYILANMQSGLHKRGELSGNGNDSVNMSAHLQTNAILLGFAAISLVQEVQELLFLVIIFDKMCSKANATPKFLHRLRNMSLASPEIDFQVRRMSIKFLHQQLVLSVAGLFKINLTVIYSMSGTLITYLVIFIQYDLSLRRQNTNP